MRNADQLQLVPAERTFCEATALAQALVDAGATTKAVAVVTSILSAHAGGMALNRIAADLGIHHKTVSRIIDAR